MNYFKHNDTQAENGGADAENTANHDTAQVQAPIANPDVQDAAQVQVSPIKPSHGYFDTAQANQHPNESTVKVIYKKIACMVLG